MQPDIKPNNILLDYDERADNELAIRSVQTSDLEDSVLLPPGKSAKGAFVETSYGKPGVLGPDPTELVIRCFPLE